MVEAAVETDLEEDVVPEELSDEDKQYEDRARRQGWRPKAEYGGDASRWVDAKTFVLRGEAELPLIRERFRKMDGEFASISNELKETKKKLSETSEVLVEFRDMSRQAEERAYKRALSEIKAKERQAVAEASEEKYNAAQREYEELGPPPKPVVRTEPERKVDTPAVVPAAVNPIYTQWIADNHWFNADRILNVYAIEEERAIQSEYPGWPLSDQLDEVKRRVMERFPEKFGNKRRAAPSPVASSSAPASKPKGKMVKDLPADAKSALEKFKKQIPGYTDADYLAMYFSGEE